ncbi:monooxygenase [Streptomyces clavuligerus]|uniref:Putative monooxygenase n=2 Tax=Streptomyces clavuligerus TaxID=1901 RepID=B5GRN7_STRCL|nr:hypothetical protein [Streptomyces clavuligerus]ANW17439.1 monooxygenase [Streptomyces clavuligerus]AXU11987.1 monooxygenase [Streptomyces clavuligerus]EDY48983.1 FscO [Streptomyces clavuligerus]EFG10073.1 putative monooxygenase [Streptomyces clavuligerus]MBY6301835.1 monooxygenase [Streptomyces clavuligerus]
MKALRTAVVGGSIGGLAAALALHRAGYGDITVYERTSGDLAERGVGVAIREDRCAELEAAGYLDPGVPCTPLTRRQWFVRGGDDPLGRVIHTEHGFGFRTYGWGSLWQGLRTALDGRAEFRSGTSVDSVAGSGEGVEVCTGAGTDRHGLVIGADGYRSVVREAVAPGLRPAPAGYWAWRGAYPEERLPDAGRWGRSTGVYVVFDGGHLVVYRIPDGGGGERVNWVLYAAPPPGVDPLGGEPGSLPPGVAGAALHAHVTGLAAERLPPFWASLVGATTEAELMVQPLYDITAEPGVTERIALVGDAATVARPHTSAGAVKALQDGLALESALRGADTPAAALREYDAVRTARGRALVGLGRRLGRALVESPQEWAAMDGAGLAAVWERADAAGLFGGEPV